MKKFRTIRLMLFPASLLVWITLAWGQVQAPVVWGEARWFGIGCYQGYAKPLALLDDTLVVGNSYYAENEDPPYYPITTCSFDNGSTFLAWERLEETNYSGLSVYMTGSMGCAYASLNTRQGTSFSSRTFRSINGGSAWSLIAAFNNGGLAANFASGQSVILIHGRSESDTLTVLRANISHDGGDHWTQNVLVAATRYIPSPSGVAFTQNHILVVGRDIMRDDRLFCTRSDRNGFVWAPFSAMYDSALGIQWLRSGIAADTSTETAIAFGVWAIDYNWSPTDIFIHRTTNGGESWEAPRRITDGGTMDFFAKPEIFCLGKLWGMAWQSAAMADSIHWGLYWRFSANHGRDWYPPQRADEHFRNTQYTSGQFVGHEVRLYRNGVNPGVGYDDYRTVTGTIAADTIQPIISVLQMPDSTSEAHQLVQFTAHVTDNDTLSEVTLLLNWGDGGVFSYPMIRENSNTFSYSFQLPEEAQYFFRIEAEDFWENVGSYPDSGWVSFHTAHWDAVDPGFIVHPSSFILSCFPNPFNSSTRISFTLPKPSFVDLNVYDVTGRLVQSLIGRTQGSPLQAGAHDIAFDGRELPSGIYFVRVEAGEFVLTRKITLLK